MDTQHYEGLDELLEPQNQDNTKEKHRVSTLSSNTHISHKNTTTLQNQEEGPLYAIIVEKFASAGADDTEWDIHVTKEWITISNKKVTLPSQGWKLHVSAGLYSAERVLLSVIPILQAEGVSFKVAASFKQLHILNYGFGGKSQVGKFITVYPKDDAQAVRLAVALHEATYGLRGPTVPSDHPLYPDSLVSYRYASLAEQLIYTSLGTVEFAIRTPSGELVPDTRHDIYKPFDWVTDPFIAAGGIDDTYKQPDMLIGKRYLIISSLHEAPRGSVYLAVDIVQGRTCVLKCARRDACLDKDGKDARDHLRYEADVLALLGPDTCFPAVFDLIEHNNDLYIAMEEIVGETLEDCARRLFIEGSLRTGQIITWGRELAAIVEKIHAKGLVYRDLKPANVMVAPDKTLRLIDFELVLKQGSTHASNDLGTRGYASPQHLASEPASITDDIYSLGALLYHIATRAIPSEAPDPFNLLERPLAVLNPALESNFIQVIGRCLEPQSEQRFHSMEAVDAALAALDEKATTVSPSFGCEPLLDTQEEASLRYRALARQLGDTLCDTAQPQQEQQGVAWLSSHRFSHGVKLQAVYMGSGGTVLALAELVAEMNEPLHRTILAEGAHWLARGTPTTANRIPGLYVGEAGIGAALLRTGQVLSNEAFIAAAVERGKWVSEQPYHSQDLMNGAAGRLRFHLLLWDETQDAEHLQAAIDAGRWLISVAEDAGEGALCWTLPKTIAGGKTYLGYAHGAAGIADALLDLFEVTGDERFLAAVIGASRLLERQAVPVLYDQSGLNWPMYKDGRDLASIFWCHGAVGIGKFFLHASELNLFPQAIDIATRAARAVARGSRWTGTTQCHGLSGNIEFLLDMFQITAYDAYYVEARSLASLLETFSMERDGLLVWPSDITSSFTPDYMVGYAGVLVCLLRLANPQHLPHQFSRPGFRRKPGCYKPL